MPYYHKCFDAMNLNSTISVVIKKNTSTIKKKPRLSCCLPAAMPSANGVAPSTDDVSLSVDDVAPSTDDVSLSVDDVAPSTDDVSLFVNDVAPSTDDVSHSVDDVGFRATFQNCVTVRFEVSPPY